jgi:hypothetical protein
MKKSKLILAGLLATAVVGSAQAATTVHITGSTAFRKATIVAIENLMTAGGGFKAAYVAASPSTGGEQGANIAILQGNINGLPAGANPVTIKASWSGSTGGTLMRMASLRYPSLCPLQSSPAKCLRRCPSPSCRPTLKRN